MKNFFKKLKEKFIDFTNYNKDEVVSDKKSEVGKKIPAEKEPVRSKTLPTPKETLKPSSELKEPVKSTHGIPKPYRKRENVSPVGAQKKDKGRVQEDPDQLAKKSHGRKKRFKKSFKKPE